MGRAATRPEAQEASVGSEVLAGLAIDAVVANEAQAARDVEVACEPSLRAPSGVTARIDGDAIIVSDASGRVVARCSPTEVELIADRRDLVLRAPGGRVRIDAALDVEITAGRDLKTAAGRDLDLSAARRVDLGPSVERVTPGSASPSLSASSPAPRERSAAHLRLEGDRANLAARRLDIDAEHANGTFAVVTLLARRIATRVDSATLEARAYELAATSVVTRARDILTEVADSVETRAGAMRSLVRGLFALHSERTAMVSKEDTSVDGKKILLG